MEAKLFVPQKSCKIWQVSISGFFFFLASRHENVSNPVKC